MGTEMDKRKHTHTHTVSKRNLHYIESVFCSPKNSKKMIASYLWVKF
jgi:hypothetical protein